MSADLHTPLSAQIDALWQKAEPTAAVVRRLARTLLLQAADAASPAWLHTAPEVTAIEVTATEVTATGVTVPNSTPQTRADIVRSSLRAGRFAAWLGAQFAPLRSDAEWLVVAALLADAGRLRPDRPATDAGPAHIGRSAALVGGLPDAPMTLVRLVARHHERSDGTGVPARIAVPRLTLGDRAVAAAVRLAELSADPVTALSAEPTTAVAQLFAEARQGAFDAELVANLFWSITGTLPSVGGFDQPAPGRWPLTDCGRRLRFDAAHSLTAGPHYAAAMPHSRERVHGQAG